MAGQGTTAEILDGVREAQARHAWQAAYDLVVQVPADPDATREADRLDLLAESAWWLGRLGECIVAREHAFLLYERAGDPRRAGQCAVWLSEHHGHQGHPAIGSGWLGRARRALAAEPNCTSYGALLLREAEGLHGGGQLDRAAGQAGEVIDLARRLRSVDLEAEALQTLGRVLISQGATDQGLAHLDEAMLLAIEGRLGPYATGKVYCSLIGACEELGDLRRAAEWTDATSRWAAQHPFAIFPGICRVHRAAALERQGRLVEAAAEAEQACLELADSHVPNAAAAHAEVGDIRRRLGDLDGAEAAFAHAEALAGRPFPGLALLRLAQGRVEDASRLIGQALDGQPWNRLGRVRLLTAQAQIAVAAGDLPAAACAVEELESVAEEVRAPALLAAARTSRARLHLAEDDPAAAEVAIRTALACWRELDVPYEVATAQVILGQALRARGEHDAAARAFGQAEAAFAELGVQADEPVPARALPAGLTAREAQVLRLVAAGRTNKEIAVELYLSAKTVSRHLSNIFAKIEVPTRAAATAFAFAHRLVQDQPPR